MKTCINKFGDVGLDARVIRESESAFWSNVVLVRVTGCLKFCVDFRKLNNKTIKDAYNLSIFDTTNTLTGAKYFSKVDSRSGYWRVEWKKRIRQIHQSQSRYDPWCFMSVTGWRLGLLIRQRLMETCMDELNVRVPDLHRWYFDFCQYFLGTSTQTGICIRTPRVT